MKLSQKQRKLITSLRQKKYRNQHDLFVVEGIKVIQEFLNSTFELYELFVTTEDTFSNETFTLISEKELKQVSNLKTPNKALAIFKIPTKSFDDLSGLVLVLDGINDPGNLGTIIRLCDWFGVQQLVCSENTVDCFNPKVVQSSMGSLTRVDVEYVNLSEKLSNLSTPIFTADMNGNSVYDIELPKNAVLVLGNEANGISEEIKRLTNNIVSIPRFGKLLKTESLNVAMATSILLSEYCRVNSLQKKS